MDEIARQIKVRFWAPEYLTWTCGYYYRVKPFMKDYDISNQFVVLKDLKKEGYLWINEEKSTNIPFAGCVIRSIDGISTKGMSAEQFFAIVAKNNTHKLTFVDPLFDAGKNVIQSEIVLQETPFWVTQLNFTPFANKEHFVTIENMRKANVKGDFQQVFDDEVDWTKYHTYDYALRGSDPLNDKKLLQYISANFDSLFKRDTKNPDLFFTVTTNTDQSISATYVPPVVQTVRSGPTTETRYNWITKKNEYVTKDSYKTIRENGYTQTNKVVNEFMEFAILDGKKVRENKSDVPPIVFQVTYKRDALNPDYNPMDDYRAVASWIEHPFNQHFVTSYENYLGWLSLYGMYLCKQYYRDKYLTIDHVIPGSEAEKAGLKKGNYIVKYGVVNGQYELVVWDDRYSKKTKHIVSLPYHGKGLYETKTSMTIAVTRVGAE